MPKWDNAIQGSPGWLKARCGMLTASKFKDAICKKGKETEACRKLKINIIAERMTDTMTEVYVNPAMQWGIETEGAARDKYEEITGNLVMPCGFALHDTIEYCGASPDGLIDSDGLLELKCPTSATHIKWKLDGGVPEEHKPQMLLQLAVTGRHYCDFMSFDPRLPENIQVHLVRFEPAPEEIKEAEQQAIEFLESIDAMWELLISE
jgi:putative phage-type endonuclease